MKSFGEIIREARQKKGIKVFELAERIGVNPVYITQIEKHNKLPSPYVARSIAFILKDKRISEAYIIDKGRKFMESTAKSLKDIKRDIRLELPLEAVERFRELKKHDKTLTHKKVFMAGVKAVIKEEAIKKSKP